MGFFDSTGDFFTHDVGDFFTHDIPGAASNVFDNALNPIYDKVLKPAGDIAGKLLKLGLNLLDGANDLLDYLPYIVGAFIIISVVKN